MSKRIIFFIILLIGVVVVFLNLDKIKSFLREDTRTVNTRETKILLREEPRLSELLDLLKENGVISDNKLAREVIEENNIDTSDFAAGKYVILSGTQMVDLFRGFTKGENGHGISEVKVNVDFNRCRDIYDIGSNISKCIIADSASIVNHIYDQATLDKYHFTKEQIPALFLPKRYQMYFDTDAEAFVEAMANEFKLFWNDDRKKKLVQQGLSSPSQAVTLASIVYSEQAHLKDEWPIIAKLYLNRLDKGMKLQSDPTFKFCWGHQLDDVQRLTNVHRDIDCNYNTYKIQGLPPGPICITPEEVVDAVLNPANVDYIYMCAKPNYSGEHNFTASGSQHARNARLYQNWLSKELRK